MKSHFVLRGIPITAESQRGPLASLVGIALRQEEGRQPDEKVRTVVCFSNNILPTDVKQYRKAAAFIAGSGGWGSHGVILARAYGIPCVVAVGSDVSRIRTGDLITLNFVNGNVFIG